ncbi:MAG: acyl-CoA thioesterase [Gammaproteobacteria bacterium]|nr:acyl-CoA thioesterase [Gammaproteobacteria bacterium]
MSRPLPPLRSEFTVFRTVGTRWMDNDAYGHVNNVVYYSYFDTVVNAYLMEATGGDIRALPQIGVVAETGCTYFASLSFPQTLEVGLAVERLGERSVSYRLGVFAQGAEQGAALGRFVHVYVDAVTRKSAPVPEAIRRAVAPLLVTPAPRGPDARGG